MSKEQNLENKDKALHIGCVIQTEKMPNVNLYMAS